jgi:hypothetical protein
MGVLELVAFLEHGGFIPQGFYTCRGFDAPDDCLTIPYYQTRPVICLRGNDERGTIPRHQTRQFEGGVKGQASRPGSIVTW